MTVRTNSLKDHGSGRSINACYFCGEILGPEYVRVCFDNKPMEWSRYVHHACVEPFRLQLVREALTDDAHTYPPR